MQNNEELIAREVCQEVTLRSQIPTPLVCVTEVNPTVTCNM